MMSLEMKKVERSATVPRQAAFCQKILCFSSFSNVATKGLSFRNIRAVKALFLKHLESWIDENEYDALSHVLSL